jgi:hypothetical protein
VSNRNRDLFRGGTNADVYHIQRYDNQQPAELIMTKTTDSFIKTNQEYVKSSSSKTGEEESAYREQPARQAPGGGSHARPDYVDWTDQELPAHARQQGLIGRDESVDRERLISQLEHARHPRKS